MDFNVKHPILLHWKHHVLEIFLRKEHKNNSHEGTEQVKNIVQQRFWIILCRAQTMIPVMAGLPTKRLDASTAFADVGVDYFGPFTV